MSEQIEQRQPEQQMYDTIERIADLLLPNRMPLSELTDHIKGYNKARAVQKIVERARENPAITKLQLITVYSRLHEFFTNGGL